MVGPSSTFFSFVFFFSLFYVTITNNAATTNLDGAYALRPRPADHPVVDSPHLQHDTRAYPIGTSENHPGAFLNQIMIN